MPRFICNSIFTIFLIAMTGFALLLFTGSSGYLPEYASITEGRIVRFEIYFDGQKPRDPNRKRTIIERVRDRQKTGNALGFHHIPAPRPTPLDREGIYVTISYSNDEGNEQQLKERWMLPCVEQFEKGSIIPVLWHPALPKPESAIMARYKTRTILRYGNEADEPADDPALRERRSAELLQIKNDFAPLHERLDRYKKAYLDPKVDDWTFEAAREAWVNSKTSQGS